MIRIKHVKQAETQQDIVSKEINDLVSEHMLETIAFADHGPGYSDNQTMVELLTEFDPYEI